MLKSLFNKILLSFLLVPSIYCKSIILITYENSWDMAFRTQEILEKEQGIPEKLITVRWQSPACRSEEVVALHLCITNQSELEVLFQNRSLLAGGMSIFKELTNEK